MGSSSWEQRCTRATPAYGTRKQRCLNAPTGTPPTPTPPVLTVFVRGRPGAVSPLGMRLPGVRRGGRQSLPPLMSTRGGGDSHYPAVPPTWVVPCSRARLFCFVLFWTQDRDTRRRCAGGTLTACARMHVPPAWAWYVHCTGASARDRLGMILMGHILSAASLCATGKPPPPLHCLHCLRLLGIG